MKVSFRESTQFKIFRIKFIKQKIGLSSTWVSGNPAKKVRKIKNKRKNVILLSLAGLTCTKPKLNFKLGLSRQSGKKQTPMWQGTLYKWLHEFIDHVCVREWVKEK